jgi:hypothetical protein
VEVRGCDQVSMGFNGDLLGFNGDFIVILWDLMGFHW